MKTQDEQTIEESASLNEQAITELNSTTIQLGKIDRTWEKYNLFQAPIFTTDYVGKPQPSNYKAILRNDQIVAIVTKAYHLLPNEVAIELVSQALSEVEKETGLKFKQGNFHTSRGGNFIYVEYLSNQLNATIQKGDIVRFGFCVRNSIDGTSGFGFDTFDLRVICDNGAIVKGGELGVYVKHTSKLEDHIKKLTSQIKVIVQMSKIVAEEYRHSTTRFLTQEQANELIIALPIKYLPSCIVVDTFQETAKIQKPQTVWTVFNEITDKVWHSTTLDVRTAASYIDQTHKILMPALYTVALTTKTEDSNKGRIDLNE